MEENKKIELNDEELDNVSGGANLDAWFASGRSGAPICMAGLRVRHRDVIVAPA